MTEVQGYDECARYAASSPRPTGNSNQENQELNHGSSRVQFSLRTEQDCPARLALGVIDYHGPRHPKYVTEPARLKSYSLWPPALPQKPDDLAKAGFFYTGYSDQVKCFYCDGGLESWEPSDSPWMEHIKWFSECAFVKMQQKDEKMQHHEGKSDKDNEDLKESTKFPGITDAPLDSKYLNKLPIEDVQYKDEEISSGNSQCETCFNQSDSIKPVNDELKGLQREVETLREERNCKICLEKEASIVFLPCGHLCTCTNCAPALQKCAVCRVPIQGLVRTYMV